MHNIHFTPFDKKNPYDLQTEKFNDCKSGKPPPIITHFTRYPERDNVTETKPLDRIFLTRALHSRTVNRQIRNTDFQV